MDGKRIVELMLAEGYDRPQAGSLSPFDELTRGLAWCIAASNLDVNYEYLDYDEDATLGEKIQIGESIELALKKMECPHRLQAHQIQGLDYPAVFPVVQWLVKQIHEQTGAQGRRNFRFGKRFKQQVVKEDWQRQIKLLKDQIELHEARLQKLKGQSMLVEQQEKIKDEINRRQQLELELSQLQTSEGMLEDENFVEKLVTTFQRLKSIEEERTAVARASSQERQELERRLNDQASEHDLKTCLRMGLAKTSRDVILLKRKLDDVPTQSELMQYERCFMELYTNIQAKLQETRKFYASYNALAEATELSKKEASLLNSISSQFEMVMAAPGGPEKFVESMQALSNEVQHKLVNMNSRVREKQEACSTLKAKLTAAAAERRYYYTLLKQLEEESKRR